MAFFTARTIEVVTDRIRDNQDSPRDLLGMIADRQTVEIVTACAPGLAEPVYLLRQEDLQGLYNAGAELYRRLIGVPDAEAVLRLMHPANVLPARTYLRLFRYGSGAITTAVAYGEVASSAGGRVVYGPASSDADGTVAYGLDETTSGADGREVTDVVWDHQSDNNETPDLC